MCSSSLARRPATCYDRGANSTFMHGLRRGRHQPTLRQPGGPNGPGMQRLPRLRGAPATRPTRWRSAPGRRGRCPARQQGSSRLVPAPAGQDIEAALLPSFPTYLASQPGLRRILVGTARGDRAGSRRRNNRAARGARARWSHDRFAFQMPVYAVGASSVYTLTGGGSCFGTRPTLPRSRFGLVSCSVGRRACAPGDRSQAGRSTAAMMRVRARRAFSWRTMKPWLAQALLRYPTTAGWAYGAWSLLREVAHHIVPTAWLFVATVPPSSW